jgi:hypothetical protein
MKEKLGPIVLDTALFLLAAGSMLGQSSSRQPGAQLAKVNVPSASDAADRNADEIPSTDSSVRATLASALHPAPGVATLLVADERLFYLSAPQSHYSPESIVAVGEVRKPVDLRGDVYALVCTERAQYIGVRNPLTGEFSSIDVLRDNLKSSASAIIMSGRHTKTSISVQEARSTPDFGLYGDKPVQLQLVDTGQPQGTQRCIMGADGKLKGKNNCTTDGPLVTDTTVLDMERSLLALCDQYTEERTGALTFPYAQGTPKQQAKEQKKHAKMIQKEAQQALSLGSKHTRDAFNFFRDAASKFLAHLGQSGNAPPQNMGPSTPSAPASSATASAPLAPATQ